MHNVRFRSPLTGSDRCACQSHAAPSWPSGVYVRAHSTAPLPHCLRPLCHRSAWLEQRRRALPRATLIQHAKGTPHAASSSTRGTRGRSRRRAFKRIQSEAHAWVPLKNIGRRCACTRACTRWSKITRARTLPRLQRPPASHTFFLMDMGHHMALWSYCDAARTGTSEAFGQYEATSCPGAL